MTRATGLTLLAAGLALVAAASRPAGGQPYAAAPAVASAVVPYYGATYGPPGGFTPAEARRVVELLESIDRRLEAIEAGAGPAAAKGPARPDALAVAARRCAGCHTPGKADGRGGGFILFADDQKSALKPLSARERSRVKEAVESGQMPPAGKLSPAERSAFH